MELLINNKTYKAKFNYGAFFKVNRELSTHDEAGNSRQDGAANLYMSILDGDLTVLSDIIPIIIGKKFIDGQIYDVIDDITEDGTKVDELLNEIKEEMKNSGFFSKSIQNYKKKMEKGLENLQKMKEKEVDDDKKRETETNIEALQEALKLLSENI